MKTEAPKRLSFRHEDDGPPIGPMSYFKSAPATWGIKDATESLVATTSTERDAKELVRAWNVARELELKKDKLPRGHYTLFEWSTDDKNQKVIRLNGGRLDHEEAIRLRDELIHLLQ